MATIDYGIHPLAPSEAPMQVPVPLPQLGREAVREVWCGPEPVELRRDGRVSLALSGPVVFGAASVPAGEGPALEAASREIYEEILAVLASTRCAYPLRFWNVFPRINEADGGLERYRWFCRGRAEAFERRFGPAFETRLCAASAVGSREGSLTVYVLASSEPGIEIENPRQLSAFCYPPAYGPRSPSFARATRSPESLGGDLFLSGTASIVGHRTLHPEDPREQVDETFRNLECLMAGQVPRKLTIFVRDPADLPAIRERLVGHLAASVEVLYLQADVCRADLLLEIEGIAG